MQYRVSELAEASQLSVDTIRFYQGRGLIPQPSKSGRFAIYDDDHLARLRRIRALLDQGFTLAQIRRVVVEGPSGQAATAPIETRDADESDRQLLQALEEENVGDGTYSRSEIAAAARVPDALISGALKAGLIVPVLVDGEERFTQADLEMAQAGLALLGAGLPMEELLGLAVNHAENVEALATSAIDLFDDHVRKGGGGDDVITRTFQDLLPQVTRLVALHFQRTVVSRALDRLRASGDAGPLEEVVAEAQAARMEIRWR